MKVIGYDLYWDEDFARGNQIIRAKSIDEALEQGDVVSLHNPSDETRELINRERLSKMKDGVVILNRARGEIIPRKTPMPCMRANRRIRHRRARRGTPPPDHPMLNAPNTVITPISAPAP